MATDISLDLKRAVIAHLEQDAALTAIVPVSRIFAMQPPATPTWPFIRYGSPIVGGFEATCWSGSTVRVTLHAFAETSTRGAGEDVVSRIAALLVSRMAAFAPVNLGIIDNEWTNTMIMLDGPEADRFHAVVEFSITAIPA